MSKEDIFPILGVKNLPNWKRLDLSIQNKILYPDQGDFSFKRLSDYIDDQLAGGAIGYGGYLERRGMYLNDELFGSNRNNHLGIDIWTEAGTPIYAAADGIIHSVANNDNHLDYGYTIIMEYEWEGRSVYCLYGHLSADSIIGKKAGMHISKGSVLCSIGNPKENGGWKPHLHLQLIKDLEGRVGDYPGVCSLDELEWHKRNCPDPAFLLGII